MGMNVGQSDGSGEDGVMIDMNTTPLIDVMLVLLVMLIITIPVQTHAVKMNMPDTNAPPLAEPPPVVSILVDFDGSVIWNGELLPDQAALEQRLWQVSQSPVQPELHIRPNRLVEYEHVTKVLAAAQRLGVDKLAWSATSGSCLRRQLWKS